MKRLVYRAAVLFCLTFVSFQIAVFAQKPLKINSPPDPVITNLLSYVNKDSLAAQMQSLVNLGTRFMYAENRKQVAGYIASRFRSYGISDVVLDSFKVRGDMVAADSVWQYNVIATIKGTTNPDQVYLYGAHHDDYSSGDKYHYAPGADDNGSGCAAAFEIARILNAKKFNPASTIRLETFSGEELMGTNKMSGAIYQAVKSAAAHENIALMVCNDMIAYAPAGMDTILGTSMGDTLGQWAGELAQYCTETYTSIHMLGVSYTNADGERYYKLGYPVTGFQEYEETPYYHTVQDSVSNCNLDFFTEGVKATFSILLSEQLLPVPKNPRIKTGRKSIQLSWDPVEHPTLQAFRIYRAPGRDSAFTLIAQTDGSDSAFADTNVVVGKMYYYRLSSLDMNDRESTLTSSLQGCLTPMNRNMLVIKDAVLGYLNPQDSVVDAFYARVFSAFPHDYIDASTAEKDSLNFAVLGQYHQIYWLSNTFSTTTYSSFAHHRGEMKQYLGSGGNLFLAGFLPSYLISGNKKPQIVFADTSIIRAYYKIKSVTRFATGALNQDIPSSSGYDTLTVDTVKCQVDPKGHIINVECMYPDSLASVIYKYGSAYDTTGRGKMKGQPVGFEYLGTDYRLVILSTPIYYFDSTDARKLISYTTYEKFQYPAGVDDTPGINGNSDRLRIYPNPLRDEVNLEYELKGNTGVSIYIYDLEGHLLFEEDEGTVMKGLFQTRIHTAILKPGVYVLQLKTGNGTASGRMIVLP